MKFEITRTSSYGDKPCEEVVEEKATKIDIRSTDDPRKIPFYKDRDPSWWYNEGENHRVEDRKIKRDFPEGYERWVLEINSLEELLAFRAKYGSLVLGLSMANDGLPCIEIYDDYRE